VAAGASTATNPARHLLRRLQTGQRLHDTRQLAVLVSNGMSVTVGGNYATSQTLPQGVDLPQSQSTATILNYASGPYGFSGQLQTDVGYGSGAAVTADVVLTAAHMFSMTARFPTLQRLVVLSGAVAPFNPNHKRQRWYVLSGYADERISDINSGNYSPDQSSPQSEDLDVAALYFLTYRPERDSAATSRRTRFPIRI